VHANRILLSRLFTALGEHDHATMASCYHVDAHFRDIAFDLEGRMQIHSMWHMICSGDIEVDFEIVEADKLGGHARLVDTYTFGASQKPPKPGRRVRNAIESRFQFEDGLILRHDDDCDPKAWARSALGRGIAGFLAGRIRFLRSRKARALLAAFVDSHPEYSQPA
jgi:hypothetical protein